MLLCSQGIIHAMFSYSLSACHAFQVCFGVAVHISYQLKQTVIYIDTTGGMTASHLLQMLQAETSNTEEQVSWQELGLNKILKCT